MNRWLIMAFAAVLFAAANGCVFWQNQIIETQEYDPVSGDRGAESPVELIYGVFRNESGSSRLFMAREPDGRIVSNEYIRWLNSPDVLMARAFYRWMPAKNIGRERSQVVRVNCTLTRFDFEAGSAVVAADFELRSLRGNRVIRVEHRIQPADDSPAAMNGAMSRAIRLCVDDLRGKLAESYGDKK